MSSISSSANVAVSAESTEFDLSRVDPQIKRIIQVKRIMNERDEARVANNFKLSDIYRQQLLDMGVEVCDQLKGPTGWRFLDNSSKKLPPGEIYVIVYYRLPNIHNFLFI